MKTFDQLPDGVLLDILSRLSIIEVSRISGLCRRLRTICKTELKRRQNLIVIAKDADDDFQSMQGYCNSPLFGSEIVIAYFPRILSLLQVSLTNIRYLRLHYCNGINDENVFLVGKYLPNLNKLWISDMGLTDEGLSILFTHCDSLNTLILGSFQMNGSCFKYLPPLKNLTIEHFEFDTQCFEMLSKRLGSILEKFSFHFFFHKHYESFNDWILERFLQNFPKLKTFKWFCNPSQFDYRTIEDQIGYPQFYSFLSTIREIEELALVYFPTLPMQQISQLPKFYHLKTLAIDFYNETSDECFAELLRKFPNLERLHFKSRPVAKFPNSIESIKSLNSLKELSLSYKGIQEELHPLFECENLRKLRLDSFDNKEILDLIDYLKIAERCDEPLSVDLLTDVEGTDEIFEHNKLKVTVKRRDICRVSYPKDWLWINSSIIID